MAALLLALLTTRPEPAGGLGTSARITAFAPASGVVDPGERAVSSARVKNTGTRRKAFWVGHSVRDGAGGWHDVPSRSVTLGPGQVSAPQAMTWTAPSGPLTTTGPYKVRMSVWSARPEDGAAVRLASAEKASAFRVRNFEDGFDSFDDARWAAADQTLGRSHLDPANVSVEGGNLEIKVPAHTLDGGAIKSESLYGYGTYRARIKTPDAPGSISAFFLYEAPDYEREVDIEIFNDGTRRVMFSTYAPHYAPDGTLVKQPTNTVTETLPFDPAAGLHDYAFAYYPGSASFYADGQLMHTFTDGLPRSPMKLWVNLWYPDWTKDGTRHPEDRHLYVDLVEH